MPQFALLLWSVLAVAPTAETSALPTTNETPVTTVSYELQGSRMAAARIKNWISGYKQPGPTVSGSGTLTAVEGEAALVLTAAHLFERKIGPITVEFPDGQVSGARILAIDRKLDVAALWIFAPKGIEPVHVAKQDPRVGETVEIWGYGPKRFRSFLATVSDPLPMSGDLPKTLVAAHGVTDNQVTIPGDSGGPMILNGKLVAIHWGYRGDEGDPRRCVHALGATKLVDWLQSQLPTEICRRCMIEPSRN